MGARCFTKLFLRARFAGVEGRGIEPARRGASAAFLPGWHRAGPGSRAGATTGLVQCSNLGGPGESGYIEARNVVIESGRARIILIAPILGAAMAG